MILSLLLIINIINNIRFIINNIRFIINDIKSNVIMTQDLSLEMNSWSSLQSNIIHVFK